MKTLNHTIFAALFTLMVANASAQTPPTPTVTAPTPPAVTESAPMGATPTTPAKPDTTGFSKYFNKSYVLQRNIMVKECDAVGTILSNGSTPIAPQGFTFTVKGIAPNGSLVISFWIWSLKTGMQQNDSQKQTAANKPALDDKATREQNEQNDRLINRETFNFKNRAGEQYAPSSITSVNDNKRYFLLGADSLVKYTVEYKTTQKWDLNFGTLVTPFKLRFNRFSFSNNLSVGGAVYYQHKFKTDWSWGTILALSLSSVTLDATSTNITPALTSSTTRPAFSPSLHGVISYKNINFTLGVGFDYLSKPSDIASATNPEAGWIYNGKPWLGIGIGFSLFSNSSTPTPANTPGQTPTP